MEERNSMCVCLCMYIHRYSTHTPHMRADILLMLIPEGILTLAIDCTCSLQNDWLWYILELENRVRKYAFIHTFSTHFHIYPYQLTSPICLTVYHYGQMRTQVDVNRWPHLVAQTVAALYQMFTLHNPCALWTQNWILVLSAGQMWRSPSLGSDGASWSCLLHVLQLWSSACPSWASTHISPHCSYLFLL